MSVDSVDYPRSNPHAFWDALYARLEAVDQPILVLNLNEEPDQEEWEAAWLAQGYSLPIPPTAELYWVKWGALRGLYQTISNDQITSVGLDSSTPMRMVSTLRLAGLGFVPTSVSPTNVAFYVYNLDGSVQAKIDPLWYLPVIRRGTSPSTHSFLYQTWSEQFSVPANAEIVVGVQSDDGRLLSMNVAAAGFIRQTSTYILPTGNTAIFSAVFGNRSAVTFTVRVTITNNPVTQTFTQDFVISAGIVSYETFTFVPTVSWAGGLICTISIAAGSGAGEMFEVGQVAINSQVDADTMESAIIDGDFEGGVTFATNWTQSGTTATTGTRNIYNVVMRFSHFNGAISTDIIRTGATGMRLKAVNADSSRYIFQDHIHNTYRWNRVGQTYTNLGTTPLDGVTNDPSFNDNRYGYDNSYIWSSAGYCDDNGANDVTLINYHFLYTYGGFAYYAVSDQVESISEMTPWYLAEIRKINTATRVETIVPPADFLPGFRSIIANIPRENMDNPTEMEQLYFDLWPVQQLNDEHFYLETEIHAGAIYSEGSTGKVYRISQWIDSLQDWFTIDDYNVNDGNSSGQRFINLAIRDPDYEHLLIQIESKTQVADSYLVIRFNDDATLTNYDTLFMRVNGATVNREEFVGNSSGITVPTTLADLGQGLNILILDYKATDRVKQALIFGGLVTAHSANNVRNIIGFGVWESLVAIANVTLSLSNPAQPMRQVTNIRVSLLRGKGRFNRDYFYDTRLA